MTNPIPSVDICGVRVSAVNLSSAADYIGTWIKNKYKTYICVAPVSTIVECRRDSAYYKIVNEAGMVTPDGVPVVWLARLKGHKTIARTYGPDLMQEVCLVSQREDYKHFFYGSTAEVCLKLITKLKTEFPQINIVGHYSPEFTKDFHPEKEDVLELINKSQPDILWVSLGSPKQDFWMKNHRDKLDVPVMIGVGAAFDFLSGVKKQAPRWMQRAGLEWFFRLICEPRRLWKRYLVGNSIFIYLALGDLFKPKPQSVQSH